MKKFSTLTKEEKEKRLLSRKRALYRAQILEAMEAHGCENNYNYAFFYGIENFEYLLKQPLP